MQIKGVASEAGEEAAGDKMPGGTRCQKLLAKALLVSFHCLLFPHHDVNACTCTVSAVAGFAEDS